MFISEKGKALARLSIPEPYRVGVVALAALPEPAFADFLDLVQKGVTADNESALSAQLEKHKPSLRDFNLPKILVAVESMQGIQKDAHVSPETFSADICDALLEDVPKVAKSIDVKMLKKRITKVVKATAIHLTSEKIKEIGSEVERSFCKARILTDVRTSFGEDPEQPPEAMMILHNLQIRYHDDMGRHREFYVTLNDGELRSLKQVIERAGKKKKTLEKMLAKANCRLFE